MCSCRASRGGASALLLGAFAAAIPVGWHFLHDYQSNRVLTLLDPEADPLGNGWHIIQSQIAVGSGGLWGKGWHHGTQSRLEFLPEHTTDFIFSVFAEEWGLVGVLLLLALYAFIIARCLWIAANAKDTYSRLLAGAISMALFVYVIVNGGMITGLLPVVGVPLPLVSYGGTSAVSLLAGFRRADVDPRAPQDASVNVEAHVRAAYGRRGSGLVKKTTFLWFSSIAKPGACADSLRGSGLACRIRARPSLAGLRG